MPDNPLIRNHPAAFAWRGVHLDLKGVPPTSKRLIELLDVFAFAGYNLVLVEWEDMFPWRTDERFRSSQAYDGQTLDRFHKRAAELQIQVVPLVQTLGHMETFLEPADYHALRELSDRTDVINPLADGAGALVASLVDEVLDRTPEIRYLHLGGDEAWSFGTHPDTRAFVEEHGKAALYLKHIDPILDRVIARGVRPILWHDMMIDWDDAAIKRLGAKADLMAWGYGDTPDKTRSHYHTRYLQRFHEQGIPLWGAGAYKGADGSSGDLPNLARRQSNALGWVEAGQRFGFQGLVATAWSRYSTHRPQNEPIDGALDVLLLVAAIFYLGYVPEDASQKIAEALQACGERQRFEKCRAFLAQLAQTRSGTWNSVQQQYEQTGLDERSTWGQSLEVTGLTMPRLQQQIERLDGMEDEMLRVFDDLLTPATIEEYVQTRVEPIHRALENANPAVKASLAT